MRDMPSTHVKKLLKLYSIDTLFAAIGGKFEGEKAKPLRWQWVKT